MRVAAALGVDRVIMSRDCADIYNSKTVRASMGAIFALKTDRVESISVAIAQLRDSGRRVFAAALDENAHKLGELEIRKGDCVLIGNEGHGISNEAIQTCDASVYIPMSEGVESLNAATAAAVLAWEFFGVRR
jgi:TrmH family RNA methyltransferase